MRSLPKMPTVPTTRRVLTCLTAVAVIVASLPVPSLVACHHRAGNLADLKCQSTGAKKSCCGTSACCCGRSASLTATVNQHACCQRGSSSQGAKPSLPPRMARGELSGSSVGIQSDFLDSETHDLSAVDAGTCKCDCRSSLPRSQPYSVPIVRSAPKPLMTCSLALPRIRVSVSAFSGYAFEARVAHFRPLRVVYCTWLI